MQRLFFLLAFFIYTSLICQKPYQGAVPKWVQQHEYSLEIENEEDQSGAYYLLSETQISRIHKTRYVRIAAKILNSEGIAQLSDLNFEFDPEYETLIFHKIEVLRDDEIINKLNLQEIQTVQRETNLERKLYDGRFTSIVNLLDIREGDIVEYSYSINGENPVYKGGFSENIHFGFSVPVGVMRYRIITPLTDKYDFVYKNKAPRPVQFTSATTKEYFWELKNIIPQFYDTNTPSWYDDQPHIYISNYNTWEDVSNQYQKLYKLTVLERDKLSRLAAQQLDAQGELELDKEKQIVSIIDFVQNDIRYFGFEGGLNSHRPESPLTVLSQRYGDCKGKSFLLSELLNEMGVEAYPMLVNTAIGEVVGEYLPSPNLFNHCVVTYQYDGEAYYIDPTISSQKGDIAHRSFPAYKNGLILKPNSKGLTVLPEAKDDKISVHEMYDVDAIQGGGSLSVTTTYNGASADGVRADFAVRNISSIQKDYLQYYSALFPRIKQLAKMEAEDGNGQQSTFEVREMYSMDSLWQQSPEDENLIYFEAYPLGLESYLNPPSSPERGAPYAITYPLDIDYTISVNLPEEWMIEDGVVEQSSDYYNYRQSLSYYDKKLVIHNKYTHKASFVEAEDVAAYVSEHQKIRNNLSYIITYNTLLSDADNGSSVSWLAIFITLLALGLAIYVFYYLYFSYDMEPKVKDAKGTPIGGWLILIGIGLVLSPILILVGLIGEDGFYNANTWAVLWSQEGVLGKPLIILVVFELLGNLLLLFYAIILVVLFFKRRSILPKLIIIYFIFYFLFHVVDFALSYLIVGDYLTAADNQESIKEILSAALRGAIWIPYFLISERVKDTFVKRKPGYKTVDFQVIEVEGQRQNLEGFNSSNDRIESEGM